MRLLHCGISEGLSTNVEVKNCLKELSCIAEKYGRTPAQIVLRRNLQRKIAVILKSVHAERILENSKIFDFNLSEEDMAAIKAMNRNERFLPDPDFINF